MKKLLLLMIVVPAFVLTPAFAATKTVDVTNKGFTPNKLTINLGDTVTWTNKDTAAHQVVADLAKFTSSPTLAAGQSYSFTFVKSGTFAYHDGVAANHKGTVTVKPGVSLTATPPVITYGATATVSGAVSSAASGETVILNAQACGATRMTRLATLTSTTNGAWTYAAKPTLNTIYEADWKNAKSAQFTVKVAPRVVLKRVRSGRFTASVTAAQTFVGKYVVFQRYLTTKRAWKTVKRVTLRTAKAGTAPTMTSSAAFRASVARRTKLRLLLTQAQAGTCYAGARSATIRA